MSEYTAADQQHTPLGRNIDEAAAVTESRVAAIRELLAGYDLKRSRRRPAAGRTSHHR